MLAKDGSMPLYLQLKELIKKQVLNGELLPGDKIPSERELCRTYGISRITVRQAIEAAMAEGLLVRQHGKGTFVARRHIEQSLSRIVRFADVIRSQGLTPSTSLLGVEVVPADIQTAEVLRVEPGTGVVNLRLLGLGNGEPMVYYNSYLPYDVGIKVAKLAEEWASKNVAFSTFDLHDRKGAARLARARQALEASVCDAKLARILKVREGAPVLVITTVFYDENDRPLEFRIASYRGDKYRFYISRDLT